MRRHAVVMLYAHYEGFVKMLLQIYIRAVNDSSVDGLHAALPLAAASMHRIFTDLRDPGRRSKYFKSHALDAETDKLAREMEFVDRFMIMLSGPIHISDDVIETEGNLTPKVLKQLSFRLDIPYDDLRQIEGQYT